MSVKARDIAPDEEKARNSGVFSARRLARQQVGFERFVAVLLLLVSLAGSVLAGGGGAERWIALNPVWWGAAAALVLQGVLSYVQWVYALQGFGCWPYRLAVLFSSALTVTGYWPLAVPWLVGLLGGWQVPTLTAQILAGFVLVLVALGVDIFPEKTLIR